MFKANTNLIGLDIGSSGIRLVQLKNGGDQAELVTYGFLPIDSRITQSDAEVDRHRVTSAIKELITKSRVTTADVVAGLPTAKVFASMITLPKMNKDELAKAVVYQAEQHVPMALDQVKLDWMLVGETADGKQHEVLLVAAPNTLTERYLNILESAELNVLAIEPDALALARAVVGSQDNILLTVDLGANSTDIVVTDHAQPKLMRSVAVGSETLVKAAAQNLNLEADQAAQFVFKFGLASGRLEGQVKKAIQSTVDNLVSEIDKSIKYFQTRYKEAKFDKVVATGRTIAIPELVAYLANSLNLPVEIGNSWQHITTPVNLQAQLLELSNQFAVACGLALRGEQ